MLDPQAIRNAREAVRPMADRLELVGRMRRYAPLRWSGEPRERPTLHLEDVSGIPFVSVVPGVEEYQHRARVRAKSGDLFAAVTEQSEGYESYCRSRLRLGDPEFVLAEPMGHAYAVAGACREGAAFARIVERAREAAGLLIHPYMAIEEVWDLAAAVAQAAGVRVEVLGPPPPVLWVANDKALLSEVVTRVLSEEWIVETHSAAEPREMVEHLLKLARHHRRAGLKRTRCASAMGNAVYDLEAIREHSPEQILARVSEFLERTEWACDEEVLIVAWEQTADSPSPQLWIPPDGHGPPVVSGVYEQLLEGEERVFLGSRPSLLPAQVNETLARASLQVGTALQAMGYAGRCSFDFILVPDAAGHRPKFTECNGRWGGTSTPMRLVDRLVRGPRPAYRAQDFMHRGLKGMSFREVCERLEDSLYDPSTGSGHYVLYNVGPLARNGKLDVVAIADTPERVEELIHGDFPNRLRL